MTKIITIANNKGGVGKTTTAQALATALAKMGRMVLLIDLESQHSLTDLYFPSIEGGMTEVFGVREEGIPITDVVLPTYQDNLHLAPASANLVLAEEGLGLRDMRETVLERMLKQHTLPYDYIIIDTSPSLGFMLLNALVAADEVIVPVQPEPMAIRGFTSIYSFIKRARFVQEDRDDLRLYLRAVLVTFYRQGHIVDEEALKTISSSRHPDYPDELMPLAPSVVPETTLFRQATLRGEEGRAQTIFDLAPDHPGAQAYWQLAEAVDV